MLQPTEVLVPQDCTFNIPRPTATIGSLRCLICEQPNDGKVTFLQTLGVEDREVRTTICQFCIAEAAYMLMRCPMATYEQLQQAEQNQPQTPQRPQLPDLELVAAKVHDSWMQGKLDKGVRTRRAEDGEELMVPYAQLSEAQKDQDRQTVKTVYAAIESLSEAGRA